MFSRFAAIARAARTAARPALVRDPAPGSAPNAGFAAMGVASAALLGLAGVAHADEAEHGLHSAAYPWPHEGMFDSTITRPSGAGTRCTSRCAPRATR